MISSSRLKKSYENPPLWGFRIILNPLTFAEGLFLNKILKLIKIAGIIIYPNKNELFIVILFDYKIRTLSQ